MGIKHAKPFVVGLVVGGIVIASFGSLYAGPPLVSAWLANYITFEFDGQIKEVPAGYTTLIYEGRTYVPAQFVAKELEAEVEWFEESKTIKVTSAKEEIIREEQKKEEILKEDKDQIKEVDERQPVGNYKKLPVTSPQHNMNAFVSIITRRENETRFYLVIENDGSTPLQVRQKDAKAVIDGEDYGLNEERSYDWDMRWYNDVRKDEKVEGYLFFPSIPEDAKKIYLEVPVLENDGSGNVRKLEFYIEL